MKTFKVHQRATLYSYCFVEAKNKKDAKEKALDDQSWHFAESQDEEIFAVDEAESDE